MTVFWANNLSPTENANHIHTNLEHCLRESWSERGGGGGGGRVNDINFKKIEEGFTRPYRLLLRDSELYDVLLQLRVVCYKLRNDVDWFCQKNVHDWFWTLVRIETINNRQTETIQCKTHQVCPCISRVRSPIRWYLMFRCHQGFATRWTELLFSQRDW